MSDTVAAALITGTMSLMGVLLTLWRTRRDEVARLQDELDDAQRDLAQQRAEAARYKAAYLGLIDLTQGLLEEREGEACGRP